MAGGKGDGRGWDDWMASPTQWHEFEKTPGVGDVQGSMACCSPWGCKALNTTERLKWIELILNKSWVSLQRAAIRWKGQEGPQELASSPQCQTNVCLPWVFAPHRFENPCEVIVFAFSPIGHVGSHDDYMYVSTDWATAYPRIWLNIILDCVLRVFLDEVNIWIVDWVKWIVLPIEGGPHLISWGFAWSKKADFTLNNRESSYLTAL